MDRVLPIDLDHARLKRGFRGYDVAAVDRLIQSAAQTVESLMHENLSLRQQNESLHGQVETYKTMENTLRDSIVLAQRAADDARSTAHRHADLILDEARNSAQAERAEQNQKLSQLRQELEQLHSLKQEFASDFRMLLDRYRRDIEPVRLAVVEGDAAAVEA